MPQGDASGIQLLRETTRGAPQVELIVPIRPLWLSCLKLLIQRKTLAYMNSKIPVRARKTFGLSKIAGFPKPKMLAARTLQGDAPGTARPT